MKELTETQQMYFPAEDRELQPGNMVIFSPPIIFSPKLWKGSSSSYDISNRGLKNEEDHCIMKVLIQGELLCWQIFKTSRNMRLGGVLWL